MYTVVTTCSADQWVEYGERMVLTFLKHWPDTVKLVVYGDYDYRDIPNLTWRRLPAWHDDFKLAHVCNDDAHGMRSGVYNYRRDCVRFSHKVAALCDAEEHIGDGVLIWIDADTFTDRDVPLDVLARWSPDMCNVSWLERRGVYPECGFMMFRRCWVLFKSLRSQYETGMVFAYPETHDSYVIQQTVKRSNLITYNISGPQSTRSHPWMGSEIGQYMDHLKGKRKVQGFSNERNV